MDTESIRQSYRPSKVRLLLIGESPPANQGFFYVTSAMTKYTAQAFSKAHGVSFQSDDEFLSYFKDLGCFLDDLCHDPVDHLPREQREKCLQDNVIGLSQRIKEIDPEVIVIALRKIETYVRVAALKSGLKPAIFVLPFPGHGHQAKYKEQLFEIIQKYIPAGTHLISEKPE